MLVFTTSIQYALECAQLPTIQQFTTIVIYVSPARLAAKDAKTVTFVFSVTVNTYYLILPANEQTHLPTTMTTNMKNTNHALKIA